MSKLKWILATTIIAFAVVTVSHFRARAIEREVLVPALDENQSYERTVHFKLFDPWVSYVPHWRIGYSYKNMDIRRSTPFLSIDLFGEIVDSSSKQVRIQMVRSGYAEEY